MEAHEDVEEDGDERDEHADECSVRDVLGHRRSYLGRADDGAARADVRVLECGHVLLRHESCALECLEEHCLCLVVYGRAVALYLVVGRHTDGLVVSTECEGTRVAAGECLLKQSAHLLGLYGLLECYDVVAASSEVDAAAESAHCEAHDEHHHDDCQC